MDARQRIHHLLLDALRALRPQARRLARLVAIEARSLRGVGQLRQRPSVIHLRLRSLGLELVENRGQLHHLALVQAQLPGQETQRTADAETLAGIVVVLQPMRGVPAARGLAAAAFGMRRVTHRTSSTRPGQATGGVKSAGTMPRAELDDSTGVKTPGPR